MNKFKNIDMKYYFLILIICLLSGKANSQVTIDKLTVDGGSTLLDFASGSSKGIILPAVQTLPSSPASGTFLFDKNDATVKMYQFNKWIELSDEGDTAGVLPYNGTAKNTQTVMGAQNTNVNGVLVLEASDKAMILPKVASPHLNVPKPYPGMMCYDTDAKALAVFDGSNWNYWK